MKSPPTASNTTFHETRARWGVIKALYSSVMLRLRPRLMLCHVSARALGTDVPPIDAMNGFATRVMTPDDLERAQLSAPEHFTPAFVAAAQARGDLCVAAFDGDRVASYAWMSFSTAPAEDGLWVQVPAPYRYAYKAFTDPAYRGLHLRDRAWLAGDQVCLQRGRTHTIAYAETHNFSSIAGPLRRGSELVGYAGRLKLFGRVFPFHSPGVRRLGFRFYCPSKNPRTNLYN